MFSLMTHAGNEVSDHCREENQKTPIKSPIKKYSLLSKGLNVHFLFLTIIKVYNVTKQSIASSVFHINTVILIRLLYVIFVGLVIL